MYVLHWGTFDLGKPRTRILRAGILAVGASLRDCHTPIWTGLEDKTQNTHRLHRLRILLRWIVSYLALIWRFLRAPRPDIVLTSFPGVLDTIVLAPFARLRGVPIAWDMFISAYDTFVFDRCLVPSGTLRAHLLRWVEGFAIRCANLVFVDTEAHARRIESLFGLPPQSCGAVQVGVEAEFFRSSAPGPAQLRAESLEVLFYGQFIPLHGIETIVAAARLMQEESVNWTFIGRGQEAVRIRCMLDELPLAKLQWVDWVEYTKLGDWIAQADLCLGIFGTSEKAASVIPNKVFQTIAAGRPLVTRDSPAIRELLVHAPPCVYLVPAADPGALAAVVREHLARLVALDDTLQCHAALRDRITAPAIGRQFAEVIGRRLVPR
jgi:glycosyltransferase involved in cell wall biosynthesis